MTNVFFQKCMPPFENVAADKKVTVTPEQMTCGLRSQNEYCIQVRPKEA